MIEENYCLLTAYCSLLLTALLPPTRSRQGKSSA